MKMKWDAQYLLTVPSHAQRPICSLTRTALISWKARAIIPNYVSYLFARVRRHGKAGLVMLLVAVILPVAILHKHWALS